MFDFLFGKKTSKRHSKKKATKTVKPPKDLLSKCKNNGIRVTVKSGGKRRYKSVKVLEKQCVVKKIRKNVKRVISEVTGEVKKPMSVNRKNVLKKKIMAAARMSNLLKKSRKALNQRYPGDIGSSLNPNAESYIPLDQRTVPTEGVKQKQDFGKRNNFGFSYYY